MKVLDCFKAFAMAIAIATTGNVCANENTLLITNFRFSHQSLGWEGDGYWEGVIDYKNKTITFATQRWIENIDRLPAIFELDGDGMVKVNGKLQFSGATINDFRRDVVYTVGDAEYTVKFVSPQASGLPVIKIDTENSAPILNKEDWVNMTFALTDPNNPKNNISRTGLPRYDRIRGRGNSTWKWAKKPYRVRFRQNISFFGLPAAENWVLLAEYRDPTFLITPTALELGRNVFDYQPFTCSYHHVHLYLNGRYDGVYILTEQRQADPLGAGAPGRVKINPDDGWFVELDIYYNEDPKFRTRNYNLPIMIKAPDFGANSADPKYDFVKNDWNELSDSLFSANFPENGYRDLIDMNTFIDFSMIQEIIHAPEFSRPASILSYKDMYGKISMGPLWDFDATFGLTTKLNQNVFFNDTSFNWKNGSNQIEASIYHNRHSFFQRFFDDPIFLAKYKERWNKKYDRLVAVRYFIEELGEKIRIGVAEDYKRWPEGPNQIYDTNHARQVELMIGWWWRRMLWLNTELNKVEILPKNKTFTAWAGYAKTASQIFTLISYGDMKNLSAALKKEEFSEFEVNAKLSKGVTGNGGYLATIGIKPKNSLPAATYTDTLILSGTNQAERFSIEVPLTFAVNEAAQPVPALAGAYNKGTAAANQALQTRNGINLSTANNATLEIFNLKGSLISRQNFSGGIHAIQLGHLPKGMYVVKVSFSNEKQILRIPIR